MMEKLNGCIFWLDVSLWDKISADDKNVFDSKHVCNKYFLGTKRKSYGDEVTDFFDKEVPKVDSNQTCLAVSS